MTPGSFEGAGRATDKRPGLVVDVDIRLTDRVPDFVNTGFDLPVLEYRGRGGLHFFRV